MNPRVIAVCGKGGAGKTTVSALIARRLHEERRQKVLMVDADHAAGLTLALQIPTPSTIDQVRADTVSEIEAGRRDKKDLAMSVDFLLMEAVGELDNLAFLSLGRPEQAGCYCSVNSLLRMAIENLSSHFDLVVIDAEAGVEQVNRRVMEKVDYLVLVADSSARSLKVAEDIYSVAGKMTGARYAGLAVNRARPGDAAPRANFIPEFLGVIPEDNQVREFDSRERSLLELPESPATLAVDDIMTKIGF